MVPEDLRAIRTAGPMTMWSILPRVPGTCRSWNTRRPGTYQTLHLRADAPPEVVKAVAAAIRAEVTRAERQLVNPQERQRADARIVGELMSRSSRR